MLAFTYYASLTVGGKKIPVRIPYWQMLNEAYNIIYEIAFMSLDCLENINNFSKL